jgi:hypothetical protein
MAGGWVGMKRYGWRVTLLSSETIYGTTAPTLKLDFWLLRRRLLCGWLQNEDLKIKAFNDASSTMAGVVWVLLATMTALNAPF